MISDAESILRICGIDSYLHIGCGNSSLVFELLKRSMDAYGIDLSSETIAKHLERAPDRFVQGSLTQYPFQSHMQFGTVIVGAELFTLSPDEILSVFKSLQRVIKNNLVLYFPPETLRQYTHRPELMTRIIWENFAIQAEFRRHPRGMLVTPYEELENEQLGKLIFFEKIPLSARENFSLQGLLTNRDLHMDMLREAGRRSDAHISRYALAATKIRPGDLVLDAACGLGYGTAVLAACSAGARFIGVDIDPDSVAYATANFATNAAIAYQACDVTQLTFLADHSVDTIVSFETIEHVPDYDKFLAEVCRVLKPDGRFIGSVPNLWCDETGQDPNPHHFHVFDWEKFNKAIAKYFIVDERWLQIAGGGYKLRNGQRQMYPVPLQQNGPVETEWWIITACANPLALTTASYSNPFHKNSEQRAPAHVDFEKYYDNPWLYRMMVQLGERLTERKVLVDFSVEIVQKMRLGSADQGAALCVICYQLLESGNVTYQDVATLATLINGYEAAYDRNNPHAYRWAVSLHYVGGRLLLALGKRPEAKAAFLTCAAMDPLLFSPLLATKTVSARMYAGLLYVGEGDLESAKQQLRLAVQEAPRVLQGDWGAIIGSADHPLSFGLQEAAEVLDIASQCAQLLQAIERQGSAAGFLWEKVNLKRFGLVEWNKSLERENENLRKQLCF